MRLAIDLRPFLSPWISGVTVLTDALITALQAESSWDLDFYYFAAERFEPIHQRFPTVRHIPISNRWFHFRSLFGAPKLPRDFFEISPDLIWIPDRRPFFKTKIPVVMTVHDAVPEQMPETLSFKSRLYHRFFSLQRSFKHVDAFLTPSQTTANFLKERTARPIHVSYACLPFSQLEALKPSVEIPESFAFFLAPVDPRKGLTQLEQIVRSMPDLSVVWAGLKSYDSRFAFHGLPQSRQVIFLSEITEPEKVWLFQNAFAFLALSEMEGFDLPVLEAAHWQCPTILSDIPVHRELFESDYFTCNFEESLKFLNFLRENEGRTPKAKFSDDPSKIAHDLSLFFRSVVVHKNRESGRDGNRNDRA